MKTVTQKKVEANRLNGQKGGVKTEAGKLVSRYNAVRHGIFREAKSNYEKGMFGELIAELTEYFQPVGILENILLERIALAYLKLFRIARAEREYVDSELTGIVASMNLDKKLGVSAVRDLGGLYLRYETTAENRLHKNIHELQRLQAIRKGQSVPLPVAVDINTSPEG